MSVPGLADARDRSSDFCDRQTRPIIP
jgi:hypothetical protein